MPILQDSKNIMTVTTHQLPLMDLAIDLLYSLDITTKDLAMAYLIVLQHLSLTTTTLYH